MGDFSRTWSSIATPNFFMFYTGVNQRRIYERVSRLVCHMGPHICSSCELVSPMSTAHSRMGRRMRVGFVSPFFSNNGVDHASVKMVDASIAALPVDRFHVVLLPVGGDIQGAVSQRKCNTT